MKQMKKGSMQHIKISAEKKKTGVVGKDCFCGRLVGV